MWLRPCWALQATLQPLRYTPLLRARAPSGPYGPTSWTTHQAAVAELLDATLWYVFLMHFIIMTQAGIRPALWAGAPATLHDSRRQGPVELPVPISRTCPQVLVLAGGCAE